MTEQRITVTHFNGEPLERRMIEFETLDGYIYRLTHYEVVDAKVVWFHGYRECGSLRFYTSRTPDELTPFSLEALLRERSEP